MRVQITALFLIASLFCSAQQKDLTTLLYDTYKTYKEPSLNKRRIKHFDLYPLIEKYRKNAKFKVSRVGTSIEGRPLSLISIGQGETDVFLWSQMHGDEPTATQAIFDIFNFF
ncbi:hypothetical protein ACU8V7_26245 [Zobellia nedashkovskayae]